MTDRDPDSPAPLRSRSLEPDGPCRWIGRGHAGAVRCLAVAPDGQRVLSGGHDGTVRLWSRDGRALATAHVHEGGVRGLAWVTGEVAVSIGADRRAVFLDEALGEVEVHPLPARPDHLACDRTTGAIAIALDGGWLGALGRGRGLVAWSATSTTESLLAVEGGFVRCTASRWEALRHDGTVGVTGDLAALANGRLYGAQLRPHPDGRRVLAVVDGEQFELYTTSALTLIDPRTGALEPWPWDSSRPVPWVGPDGAPLTFTAGPPTSGGAGAHLAHPGAHQPTALAVVDAALVITGALDGAVRGWDPRPRPRPPIAGRLIEGAARRPGEICTREDGRAQLHWWSADDARHLRTEKLGGGPIHQVALSADAGRAVVTTRRPRDAGGWAGLARWTGGTAPAWETTAPATCQGVTLAEGGALGAVERTVYRVRSVWGAEAELFDRPSPHQAYGGALVAGPGRVISWDTAGLVCGWAEDGGPPVWQRTLAGGVHAAVMAAGGDEVAVLCVKHPTLSVAWLDAATGELRAQTAPAPGSLASELVAREDGVVVAAGAVPTRFERGAAPGVTVPGLAGGYCAMVHEHGRHALHQAQGGARTAVEIDSGRAVALGPEADGDVMYQWTSLGLGPDGAAWMACALVDGELATIDLTHARVVRRWRAHAARLLAMAADATRTRLVTASIDGRVKVWRVSDGTLLGDWAGPRAAATVAAWTADEVTVWGCDPDAAWVVRRYRLGEPAVAWEGAMTWRTSAPHRPLAAARWQLSHATEVAVIALDDGRVLGRATSAVKDGLVGGALAPDARHAFVSRFDSHALIDLGADVRRSVPADQVRGRRATLLPDDRLLLVGPDVRMIDACAGRTTWTTPVLDLDARAMHHAVDPAGRVLVVAEATPDGRAWWLAARRLDDGALAWRLECPPVTALALDGADAVIVGYASGVVEVRDAAAGACRARWEGAEAVVDVLPLAGARVAVIDAAGYLRVLAPDR